jgi:hypothetical protein
MIIEALAFFAAAMLAAPHDHLKDLNIGDAAPRLDHAMAGISGERITLKEVAGEKGLLVIFTSNQCPFVVGSDGSEGWEGRYGELHAFSKGKGVGMALINSNHATRAKGESMEDMQGRYREKNYAGHYLLDENSTVADAFAARTTPHVFLFDKDMKLVYKGAIDDSVASSSDVKEPWLKNALTNLNEGRAIEPATTRNIGCSIKRAAHVH